MKTLAQQKSDALDRLKLKSQPTVEPQLTDTELIQLLDDTKRAAAWTASIEYDYGDVVMPTKRNGHRYRCINGGISGVVEPNFPKCDAGKVSEGAGSPPLQWQEDGPDYRNVYDVRAAIRAAWLLKAAKATELVSKAQGNSRIELQQVYEHCLEMAAKYAPVGIA